MHESPFRDSDDRFTFDPVSPACFTRAATPVYPLPWDGKDEEEDDEDQENAALQSTSCSPLTNKASSTMQKPCSPNFVTVDKAGGGIARVQPKLESPSLIKSRSLPAIVVNGAENVRFSSPSPVRNSLREQTSPARPPQQQQHQVLGSPFQLLPTNKRKHRDEHDPQPKRIKLTHSADTPIVTGRRSLPGPALILRASPFERIKEEEEDTKSPVKACASSVKLTRSLRNNKVRLSILYVLTTETGAMRD